MSAIFDASLTAIYFLIASAGFGAATAATGAIAAGALEGLAIGATVIAVIGIVVGLLVGISITHDMVAVIDNPAYDTPWDDPLNPLEPPPFPLPPSTQPPWLPTPPPGQWTPPVNWPTGSVWPNYNANRGFTEGLIPPAATSVAVASTEAVAEIAQATASRPEGLYVTVAGSALGVVSNPVNPQPAETYTFTADPATIGLVSIVFDPNVGEAGAWKATCSQDPQLTWYSAELAGAYLCYSEGPQDVDNLGFTIAVQ